MYIYLYIYPLLVYHKTGAAVKSFCKKIREFYLSEHAKKALFMWVKKAEILDKRTSREVPHTTLLLLPLGHVVTICYYTR